ncbi:MAG: polysaccharide biosynthesis/export family protein [Pseudomonadales bacterium]|nr:polysaccharide biosynthesis/export family protein [Pseudomonadales bacterium]
MKTYGLRVCFIGLMLLVFGGSQQALAEKGGATGSLFSGEFDDFSKVERDEKAVAGSKTDAPRPKPSTIKPGLASPVASDSAGGGDSLHYKIGVGDNVRVHVWRNADLSISVPVRPDGYISMPLLGDIKASGLRPTELAEVIKKKLASYLRDPRVSVIMQGLSSNEYINRVRVTGAVNRPTSIPFREGMTVLDLILDTGGVSQFASPNKTKIFRKVGGKSEVLKVRLKDILEKADLKTNYAILPGDVITVPERLF